MLINSLAKKHVVFTKSGLTLSFNKKDSYLNLQIKGYDINVPIDLPQLEVVNFLTLTLEDAKNGHVRQNAWENPEIQMDGKFNHAQSVSLSYYIILSFLNNSEFGTRDIWLIFRNAHHSLLSYLRSRAITSRLLMQYKVAILICYLKKYDVSDIDKIERTFLKCGLSRQNYIFYLLFLLDGTLDDIEFDQQGKFLLSVDEMEQEKKDFIDTTSISRLCMWHTMRSLSFIVNSHNLSPQEMANELRIATEIAYTTVRPLRSREYSENYARRAMTNTVSRIQHAYTKYPGKVRLIGTEEGSKGTHFTLEDSQFRGDDIDPLCQDSNVMASVLFSENSMIDYIDAKRAAIQ